MSLGLACAGAILVAQQPTPSAERQAPAVFRAGIDVVQLDVSVIDKKTRLPVRGLTTSDFTILEDGKPQPAVAFAAVDIPEAPAVPIVDGKPVTWLRNVASDVQTNSRDGDATAARLFVLVIDDAMIPLDPWVIQQTKKAARSVIEKLNATDRMAVVMTVEGHNAQDFTGDREKLLRAIERMHPGYAQYMFGWDGYVPPQRGVFQPPATVDGDIQFRDMSAEALTNVAAALTAAPERRKTVIYLGPGIPINSGLAASPRLADGSSSASYEANKRLFSELPELFRRMQRANINVYAIDPTGIAGIGSIVAKALSTIPAVAQGSHSAVDQTTGALRVGRAGPGGSATPDPTDYAHFVARLDMDFLLQMAANTGGQAIVNNDDFEPGIQQMFRENGSYYLLGYRAPAGDPPGSLHRLKVLVKRTDVEVRTRSGYYTAKPDKADKRVTPLAKAVASLLPNADLPLQVAIAPVAGKTSTNAVVTIVLGMQSPAGQQVASDSVDIQISSFTPDGVARGTSTQKAAIAIRAATSPEPIHYEALSQISLKPGRYQLRIAAHSTASNATGSVFADVEVPDFSKERVSLSGVFIEAQPGVASAPKAAFAPIAPVSPTSERTFTKRDRVSAFLRVYQGGTGRLSTVPLKTRIINESGIATMNDTIALAPELFDAGTRSSDHRLEIPVATLTPGRYLLALEATIDAVTARRYVRFIVQ